MKWLLAVLAVLALACGERGESHEAAAPEATVPGVETAVATTATVRDAVRGVATVAADAEPAEVRDARAALAEAEARRDLAARQLRRLEGLAGGVAPRKELDAARAEAAAAAAAADKARATVAAFGGAAAIEPVGPDTRWVIARVMQGDVPRVEGGGEASFVADALPGERWPATVVAPPAYIDHATLSAPVRLRVRDPERRLRPGMTGVADIEVGPPRTAVVVPARAVVYDDVHPVIFVVDGDGYVARPVEVGSVRDGQTEVRAGLAPGARIVVTGAASLLSQGRLPTGAAED
ncbi:MAG TPA: efflux RND transporter periplasmic adaptor subunit [Candidatus Binatia bacterium]|nr:efflux RND transporter periplasmic adaptor subunit [Candidatus Binatia bacterium]